MSFFKTSAKIKIRLQIAFIIADSLGEKDERRLIPDDGSFKTETKNFN